MSQPQRAPFGARLADAMARFGPLCVGIDPHPSLLQEWGLPDDVHGLGEFALQAVTALAPVVAAIKPQAAFFERFGSAGMAVLEDVIARARELDVLCIVDAKRGDIGSTMEGYARAYCTDASALAGDAVTLSPYLGYGSLAPAIDLAMQNGRGVFVLALTSNPQGMQLQHSRDAQGRSVASAIAAGAAADNARAVSGGQPLGDVGLVVGATVGDAAAVAGIDLAAVQGPLLAPGIGAQGATAADLPGTFGAAAGQVLASASRSVLGAGPDTAGLRSAAAALAGELRNALAST